MDPTTGTDTLSAGTILHTRTWHPDGSPRGGVLCLHGVESHGAWFDDLAPRLADQGYAVHVYDRPGWGQSPGVRGHLASYADAIEQIDEVATRLRDHCGTLHLAGLSWGGLLALYAALRRGALFDSVTLIAPGLCPKEDLPRAGKLKTAAALVTGASQTAIPLAIQVEHFTRDADRTHWIRSDPHRTTQVSASFCLETLKLRAFIKEQLARRPLPPTQCLLAGDDAIIDNDATRALLQQAGDAVTLQTYNGAAHSLVFEDPARVAKDIVTLAERAEAKQASPGRVAVMGAGAVGSAVGGLLALGGCEVTLIARPAHAEAVNRHGLRLRIGAGERIIRDRLTAITTPEEITEPIDLALLTVKSFDTENALAAMRPLIGNQTAILSLQNGTENEGRIAAAYPETPILGGAICAYLSFAAPGEIVWSDDRGGIAYAAVEDGPVPPRVRSILSLLRGMEARAVETPGAVASIKWSKLMLNVAFNALNAVTGLPTGEILAHSEYGALAARALREGFAVLRGLGVAPVDLPGYPVTKLALAARLPAGALRRILAWKTRGEAAGQSSMAQDLAKGKAATEIDEINGAVVRGGQTANVPTPANDSLCRMVREATERARANVGEA